MTSNETVDDLILREHEAFRRAFLALRDLKPGGDDAVPAYPASNSRRCQARQVVAASAVSHVVGWSTVGTVEASQARSSARKAACSGVSTSSITAPSVGPNGTMVRPFTGGAG